MSTKVIRRHIPDNWCIKVISTYNHKTSSPESIQISLFVVTGRFCKHTYTKRMNLTLNLPTTTIVAQPFNVIKWQLKFNPVA